jgi:uncharacterized iron-regulated protein
VNASGALLASLVVLMPTLAALPTPAQSSADEVVGAGLPYPPERRPAPDEIVHVPTGVGLSFDGMMDMVAGARLVCIGESHDNVRAHEVQLQVIRELYRRFPDRLAIGMEMFRQPQQEVLDRWTRGELGELEFLEAVDWHRNWSTDYRHYAAILEFARDERVDVIALNPSRELQDAVRQFSLDALPDEFRDDLPEVGDPDPYQHAVLEAFYGGHLPTPGAFESFFRVQLLWEESMAERVVDYLGSERGRGKIMVTLTGSGHVEYGFGVPRKVIRRMPLPYVIIAPTEIEVPPEKQMPDVHLPELPLHPADFIWWIPYVELEAGKVRLGVGVEEQEGAVVVSRIEAGSSAERAGMQVGDEIALLAGQPVGSVTTLVHWVGRQSKGTAATVTVRRNGVPLDLRVEF